MNPSEEAESTCDLCDKKAVWIDKTQLGVFSYCEVHQPMPNDIKESQRQREWEQERLRERSAMDKKSKTGQRYKDIFTEDVLRNLYERYIIGEGRSINWLSKKENNGLATCSGNTLFVYFRKFGLEPVDTRNKRKPPLKQEALVVKPQDKAELPIDLPSSLNKRIVKACEQIQDLQKLGILGVTGVTLSFDLKIEK